MASAVNPITGSSSTSSQSAQGSTGLGATAPTEEMFLQLLVAQMQNQDPLNPTDSTQFVSQLAQFSELEQVIGIRQDIEGYAASAQAGASTGTGAATGTGATSGTGTSANTGTGASTPAVTGTTSTQQTTQS